MNVPIKSNPPKEPVNNGWTNTGGTGSQGGPGGTSYNTGCKYIFRSVYIETHTGNLESGESSSQGYWTTVVELDCENGHNAPPKFGTNDSDCPDPDDGEVPVIDPMKIVLDPSFSKNEKLMCIWNKLRGIKGMEIQLKGFDSDMSIFNLKIEVKPFDYHDGYTRNGATRSYAGSNDVLVLLNEDKLNRPVLDIARTIYHEAIHAEMYRKVREHGNVENVKETDYPGIYDYYRRYIKQWQHELMAEHYVEKISKVLKSFDGGYEDDEVYEALAWVGLKGYRDGAGNFLEYTAWKNLSSSEQGNYVSLKNEFMKRGSLLCGN